MIYKYADCSGLNSIVVDKNNPFFDSRNDCNAIIETETSTLIAGCSKTVIPNSVISIGWYAFSGCSLTSLIIPNNITSIGWGAFKNCLDLVSVTIPNSVTYIDDGAFAGCDAIVSIIVKRKKTFDIYSNVFSENTYQLATLYVPKGSEQYYKNAIGWKNFVHVEEIDIDMETSLSPFSDIGANQMILGYYRTDDHLSPENSGYGGTNKGTYKVCIGFDKEKIEPLVGNKITHVRFALVNTDITNAKIWISNARDSEALYTQRVPSLTTGWNEVKLDRAFEIMEDSIVIGLEYYQEKMNYPISCVSINSYTEEGSGYIYGPYGDNGESEWKYITSPFNEAMSLSMQCLIEGDQIPEYDIHITGVKLPKKNYKKGEVIEGTWYLQNWGKKAIDNYEVVCTLDDIEVDSWSSFNELIYRDYGYFSFRPQNLLAGKHNISITVKSINGNNPIFTGNDTQSVSFNYYQNDMGRQKILLDMHTATWCPYSMPYLYSCKELAQKRDDVSFVFIHHIDDLSCDVGEAYGVFASVIPTAYSNRSDYYLDIDDIDKAKAMPSSANVNISADYNDKTRQLKIKVTGEKNDEFDLLEEYTNLTVLLTEDDVINPQYDGENKKYIYDFKHQAVLRANVSDIWGDPVVWNGDKYEMNYTTTLDESWEEENMKIVAFLAKPFTGNNYDEISVINCNDFAVKKTLYQVGDDITSLAPAEWKGKTGDYGGLENPAVERYTHATPHEIGDVLTQTISGLKNGTYCVQLEVAASFTSGRGFECPIGDRLSVVFANETQCNLSVMERDWVKEGEQNSVTISATVTDGTLKYGIKNLALSGNWFVARLKSIVYVSTEVLSPNTYAIYFNSEKNGKTVTDVTAAEEGSKVFITVTPDDGYTLESLKVTTIEGLQVEVTNNFFVMPPSPVKVESSFTINKYKLTYTVDGDTFKTFDVEYGATIATEAEPEKEGYTFSGWSEIPVTMPAKDVTITGSFTKTQYQLTYMVDGEIYKIINLDYDVPIIAEEEPEKEGYTFSGWSEIPAMMPAKDVTVTGSFTINTYTLTYMVDDETYKTYEVPYGTDLVAEAEPQKDDHIFSGWSLIPETMPAEDVIITGFFTFVDSIEDAIVKDGIYQIYTLDGKPVDTIQKGVNIIYKNDGQVIKVFIK